MTLLNRPFQSERLPDQPSYRRDFLVDVSCNRLADEEEQSLDHEFVDDAAFDIGMTAGDERRLDFLRRHCFEPEGDKFIFNVPPGKIAAPVNGVKLISRTDIEHEFSALLNRFTAEVFILNPDQQQRRIVGNTQSAKRKLNIAFALPCSGNQIESGGRCAIRLGQWNFMKHRPPFG